MTAAVRVSHLGDADLTRPLLSACPLVVALDRFATRVAQPAAREHLGTTVRSIGHLGGFSCRSVRHQPAGGPLSEHAFGLAIDIDRVTLADGSMLTVTEHWHDSAGSGHFWRDISDAAGDYFSTVITPDDDAWHRNHLHLGLANTARQ